MAEPTFQPGALPIVSGLAQIEQIKGAREARGLAQQRFDLLKRQAETEAIQQATEQKRAMDVQLLDVLEGRLEKETNPDAIRSIGSRINTLQKGLFPDHDVPAIDFDRLALDATALKQFQRDISSFRALEKELGPDDETTQAVFDAMLVKHGKRPKAEAAIGEVLETGRERVSREALAKLAPKEAAPAILAGAKPAEVKALIAKPEEKKVFKVVPVGKGMEELQLLDAEGNKIRTVGKPSPRFKPTKGKPFKQEQVLFFKVDEEGNPVEVKSLKAIDGSVSIDKMNKLLDEGFKPKGFTRPKGQTFTFDFGVDTAPKSETVVAGEEPVERATKAETVTAIEESRRQEILNDARFLRFSSDTKRLREEKGQALPTEDELIKEFIKQTGR